MADFYSTPGLNVEPESGSQISTEGTTGAVQGFAGINRYLQAFNKNLAARHEKAIMVAGRYLQLLSQRIVPIETGRLYQSANTTKKGSGWKTEAVVSYNTPYALYVHEDLDKAHGAKFNQKYAAQIATGEMSPRGPTQQAKFLEQPARENRNEIGKVYREAMKK